MRDNPDTEHQPFTITKQTVISEDDYLAMVSFWITGIESRLIDKAKVQAEQPAQLPPLDERYIDLR